MFQFSKLAANVLNSIDAAAAETLIQQSDEEALETGDRYGYPSEHHQPAAASVAVEQYEEQITALKKALRHQQMESQSLAEEVTSLKTEVASTYEMYHNLLLVHQQTTTAATVANEEELEHYKNKCDELVVTIRNLEEQLSTAVAKEVPAPPTPPEEPPSHIIDSLIESHHKQLEELQNENAALTNLVASLHATVSAPASAPTLVPVPVITIDASTNTTSDITAALEETITKLKTELQLANATNTTTTQQLFQLQTENTTLKAENSNLRNTINSSSSSKDQLAVLSNQLLAKTETCHQLLVERSALKNRLLNLQQRLDSLTEQQASPAYTSPASNTMRHRYMDIEGGPPTGSHVASSRSNKDGFEALIGTLDGCVITGGRALTMAPTYVRVGFIVYLLLLHLLVFVVMGFKTHTLHEEE